MRQILKQMKPDRLPSLTTLNRMLHLVSSCKAAAFELYHYLTQTQWKLVKMWEKCKDKDVLKLMAKIFEKLISFANADYKKEGVTCTNMLSNRNQSPPIRNNSL